MKRIFFILPLTLILIPAHAAFAQTRKTAVKATPETEEAKQAQLLKEARGRFLANDIVLPGETADVNWIRVRGLPAKKEDGTSSPKLSLKKALIASLDYWVKPREVQGDQVNATSICKIIGDYNKLLPSDQMSLTVDQVLPLLPMKLSPQGREILVAEAAKAAQAALEDRNPANHENANRGFLPDSTAVKRGQQ